MEAKQILLLPIQVLLLVAQDNWMRMDTLSLRIIQSQVLAPTLGHLISLEQAIQELLPRQSSHKRDINRKWQLPH